MLCGSVGGKHIHVQPYILLGEGGIFAPSRFFPNKSLEKKDFISN